MPFQVHALDPAPFAPLFSMSDEELTVRHARRVRVTGHPGFPCRISLIDAPEGEEVILTNFTHHDVDSPYRSNYAIYVREGVVQAQPERGELPPVLQGRPIAVRAFDEAGNLIAADLGKDDTLRSAIDALLCLPETAYLHLHNAMHGCYAAKVTR